METRNAKEVLERMTLEDIVKMINNSIDNDNQISNYAKIHYIDDSDWWSELFIHYGAYNVISDLLDSLANFNKNDTYFYYDDDTCAFYSFSCKEELVDFIGEDNLIEMIELGEDCQ